MSVFGCYRVPLSPLFSDDKEFWVVAGWLKKGLCAPNAVQINVNGRLEVPTYLFEVPVKVRGIRFFDAPLLAQRLHFLHLINSQDVTDELRVDLTIDGYSKSIMPLLQTKLDTRPSISAKERSDTVGICLPVHRPPIALLEQQLKSIQVQNYKNWHLWISDNGVDEGVTSLLNAWTMSEPRSTLLAQPAPLGHYDHFRALLKELTPRYKYVALSDHDDFWRPEKLAKLVSKADGGIAYSDMRMVDESGELLHASIWEGRSKYTEDVIAMSVSNVISGTSMLIDTTSSEALFPLPQLAHTYHDHWLALASAACGQLKYVDEILMDYVQHDANVIGYQPMGITKKSSLSRLLSHKLMLTNTRTSTSKKNQRFLETNLKNYFDVYLPRRLMIGALQMRLEARLTEELRSLYVGHDTKPLQSLHRRALREGWRTANREVALSSAMTTMDHLNLRPIPQLPV